MGRVMRSRVAMLTLIRRLTTLLLRAKYCKAGLGGFLK